MKQLLIGCSADPRVVEVLGSEIGAQIMLAAKVRMRDGLLIEEVCEHINRLEERVKARVPEVGWCFIEPDVAD